MLGAAYYTLRLATRNPDVTWRRGENPEPWQEYSTKQYKVKKNRSTESLEKSIRTSCTSYRTTQIERFV